MRLSSTSLALAFAVALAGCAATAPLNPAFQLTGLIELPAESSNLIRLPATLRYTVPATDRAADGHGQQFYVVAGAYRPYKYNQAGTFYLGEQPAIVERQPAASGTAGTVLRVGGIWIPVNPAAAPKLFILPDYYMPLPGNAPIPDKMTASNLGDFQHETGRAGGAIADVFALLGDAHVPQELAFVTGDITDREAVRRIRAAFASGRM